MTYEQALDWIMENWDMYDYDSYDDWHQDIFAHFRYGESLEESFTFNKNYLERAWIAEFGSLDIGSSGQLLAESEVRNLSLPKAGFIPRIQTDKPKILPQPYRSEQFKPTLEKQILSESPTIALPYTGVKVQQRKVSFFQRLKRIFTVRRKK